ncbi:MAG: hypothetical protein Q9191_005140 [Dirinaria sp. TL-2023a]
MADDEARAAAKGRAIQKDSLGLPVLVGTESESEWLRTSTSITEPTTEGPSINESAPPATQQAPRHRRPALSHQPLSGFAQALIEAEEEKAPKFARGYVEARHEPTVVKGFDIEADTELAGKDSTPKTIVSAIEQEMKEHLLKLRTEPPLFPNRLRTSYDGAEQHVAGPTRRASMSAIGQELKERDLLSPYDSSLDSSSWTNNLLAHMPRTSYDGAQQSLASLEPGEAFASQASPNSPAFGSRRVSDTDRNTNNDSPPRTPLGDGRPQRNTTNLEQQGEEAFASQISPNSPAFGPTRRFSDSDSDTDSSDTPPRSLLVDSREDVVFRARDHGSEVEVVTPSPNTRRRRRSSSNHPPGFFDHIGGDPMESNSLLDRLP